MTLKTKSKTISEHLIHLWNMGVAQREIADRLGMSRGNVASRLSRLSAKRPKDFLRPCGEIGRSMPVSPKLSDDTLLEILHCRDVLKMSWRDIGYRMQIDERRVTAAYHEVMNELEASETA